MFRKLRDASIVITILVIATALIGCSCGGAVGSATEDGEALYSPKHAIQFKLEKDGESAILTTLNPWQGAEGVEKRLFIEREGSPAPEDFEGTVVRAPLKRVVCMSSSYVAYIDELGEIDAVKAVSGARFISNPTVRERYSKGEVRDVGHDSNVNFEMMVALKPDLVLIYGMAGEDNMLIKKLEELSLPYAYIGEYLEESPLGKAEWIVPFGELFDRREEAVEKFQQIADSYEELEERVKKSEIEKPIVMLNAPFRDVWYMPGDRSYMVQLIDDAGGEYACRGVDSNLSRPIGVESAFVHVSQSDYWLAPGMVTTMAELKSLNPRFTDVAVVKEGRVYNNNARITDDGGSDFWESGAVRPDIVLSDIVKILHPELLPNHDLYYFRHLQ